MEKTKYESPFPNRQITGADFNELVNYVNEVIQKSDLSHSRLEEVDKQIDDFNNKLEKTNELFQSKLAENERTIKKIHNLDKRIDNFYSKIIEIVGVFIAIFSFIIAGIQISFKAEGTFEEILLKSSAIFLPILVSIIILLVCIRFITKR